MAILFQPLIIYFYNFPMERISQKNPNSKSGREVNMKKARIVLIGFFVCVFLLFSFSVSFSQVTSSKAQDFLAVIQAATSLPEVKAAFDSANLTRSEIGQVNKTVLSSPALKQKMDLLYSQASALRNPEREQVSKLASANLETMKAKLVGARQTKEAAALSEIELLKKQTDGACGSDSPIIEKISIAPIEPGLLFAVSGKGFGKSGGSIDLLIPGFIYQANIVEWNECWVEARLPPEISGVNASYSAKLILKTAGGKEISTVTSFQPLFDCVLIFDSGEVNPWVGTSYWVLNHFLLTNNAFVSERTFESWADSGHAEITYASDLNVPNSSAVTYVHGGCTFFGRADWNLFTSICRPKGLPYR